MIITCKIFITYAQIQGDFINIYRIIIACIKMEIQITNKTPKAVKSNFFIIKNLLGKSGDVACFKSQYLV